MRVSNIALAVALVACAALSACGSGGGGSAGVPGAPFPPALVAGPESLTVSWTPVDGASTYTLYVAAAPGVDPRNYGILPYGAHVPGIVGTEVTVNGLAAGTTYYACVAAVNGSGEGAPSREASALLPPNAPVTIFTTSGIASLRVTWTPAFGATAYDLYVATDPAVGSNTWSGLPGARRVENATVPTILDGLENGTTYYVVVAARNAGGASPDSYVAPVTPSARGTFVDAGEVLAAAGSARTTTADFDRDGILDLAVANADDATVIVLRGLGGGAFAAPVAYPVGASPAALVAVDLDGNGAADLVSANAGDGTVSVLLNDGAGGFPSRTEYPAGLSPLALAVASVDSDLDGSIDLVLADAVGSSVEVLLNDGSGGFLPPLEYATGAIPTSIAVGDFDGDGRVDVATGDGGDAAVTALVGDGLGGFVSRTDLALGATPASLVARDFDGDTVLDLAVTVSSDGSLTVLHGNGDGTFEFQGVLTVGSGADGMVSGDFDGDGTTDLAVADAAAGAVRILRGTGLGTFVPFFSLDLGGGPATLSVGDFNGDGILDLAASDPSDGTVVILLGSPD